MLHYSRFTFLLYPFSTLIAAVAASHSGSVETPGVRAVAKRAHVEELALAATGKTQPLANQPGVRVPVKRAKGGSKSADDDCGSRPDAEDCQGVRRARPRRAVTPNVDVISSSGEVSGGEPPIKPKRQSFQGRSRQNKIARIMAVRAGAHGDVQSVEKLQARGAVPLGKRLPHRAMNITIGDSAPATLAQDYSTTLEPLYGSAYTTAPPVYGTTPDPLYGSAYTTAPPVYSATLDPLYGTAYTTTPPYGYQYTTTPSLYWDAYTSTPIYDDGTMTEAPEMLPVASDEDEYATDETTVAPSSDGGSTVMYLVLAFGAIGIGIGLLSFVVARTLLRPQSMSILRPGDPEQAGANSLSSRMEAQNSLPNGAGGGTGAYSMQGRHSIRRNLQRRQSHEPARSFENLPSTDEVNTEQTRETTHSGTSATSTRSRYNLPSALVPGESPSRQTTKDSSAAEQLRNRSKYVAPGAHEDSSAGGRARTTSKYTVSHQNTESDDKSDEKSDDVNEQKTPSALPERYAQDRAGTKGSQNQGAKRSLAEKANTRSGPGAGDVSTIPYERKGHDTADHPHKVRGRDAAALAAPLVSGEGPKPSRATISHSSTPSSI